MINKNKSQFGLPEELSLYRMCRVKPTIFKFIQHKIKASENKETIYFNKEGICGAWCMQKKIKLTGPQERKVQDILNKYRSRDGSYDVLIPGSGGRTVYTPFLLKKKYNMNPLTCTWSPGEYTDIGWKNYKSWINSGFDNVLFTPNKKIHGLLTRVAFENVLHPFQPFALGQYSSL